MRPFKDTQLEAIESLYRERFTYFVRVATATSGDHELGLEAVQEAFANVVRARRRYRAEAPLEAWVWRAVVNAARKARTREARGAAATDAEQRRNGHEPAAADAVATAIALLPERQRLALFLRYYADLDYRSIALALGVEVGTVSATLSAAHTSVRRALQAMQR
jgi:RNA polymerase sigma factor (sigma-70 family)